MSFNDKINQPEGRRLEFKSKIPAGPEIAKTIIAFANDAGGELYIGVQDNPRNVLGLDEDDLLMLEEKISNIVHDNCNPIILPEISFFRFQNKYLIKIQIYKGNNPPYYLKSRGIDSGTFIRVGSSNRAASPEMIAELERRKNNISFDSILIYEKELSEIDISSFVRHFKEKTGENAGMQTLSKLRLFDSDQGKELPTNALILLSDDDLQSRLFPYAKIECARFKGITPGDFIDQKTISGPLSLQAESAYQFILRHISQGSSYDGVYRIDRWEYPVTAIREAIRNAVIHRDYSLTGKDIKIAVFDNKIEITSPGKLLPTVDYNQMEAGQSDIRNMVLAPVFKKLGIIEQWGNGLQLISDEMKQYPEIDIKWNEPGMAFRISFIKRDYIEQPESRPELEQEPRPESRPELRPESRPESRPELEQDQRHESGQELKQESIYDAVILSLFNIALSKGKLAKALGQKSVSGGLKKVISKLMEEEMIEWTIPEKPNSSKQKYRLTEKGKGYYKTKFGNDE